jgi:hypothetical protein
MSIIKFIDRVSAQTALHWANPVNDGYGNYTYDEPVEIACRWEDVIKIINNSKGEEFISNAEILTNTEMEEGDMVFLGVFADIEDSSIALESGQIYPTPTQVLVQGVYKIVAKSKIPLFRSSTKFVKMYYLKPNWETKL